MSATVAVSSNEWSVEALINKSQVYAARMKKSAPDDWEYALWSSFILELLARAALSNTSPCLLADPAQWQNVYFALTGVNKTKAPIKSYTISKILDILNELHTDIFAQESVAFSKHHINRRNEELHSGGLPFQALGTSEWLPHFFIATQALLKIMGKDLSAVFAKDTEETAQALMEAFYDQSAKVVKQTVQACKTLWDQKDDSERAFLAEQAVLVMSKQFGHRVECPACKCTGLVQGEKTGVPNVETSEIFITVKQPMLPANFECVACGLKISGYSKLNACGLGNQYISTIEYDPIEYFGIEMSSEPEEWEGFMEDNNE